MNEEMVCLYCDSTGLFSEEECDEDNLCDMLFPQEILREWYRTNEDAFMEASPEVIKGKLQEMKDDAWKYWFDFYSTAEDTDGLFQFALDRGVTPKFGVLGNFHVYSVVEGGNRKSIHNGTYDDCRWFCREHGWKWEGHDLAMDF